METYGNLLFISGQWITDMTSELAERAGFPFPAAPAVAAGLNIP